MNGTIRAISLSVLVHLFLLLSAPLILRSFTQALPTTAPTFKPLELKLQPRPQEIPANEPKQIVDLNDTKTVVPEAPKDAKFLGDKNRSVGKETQATLTGPNMRVSPQNTPPKSASSNSSSEEKGVGKTKPKLSLSPHFLNQDAAKTSAIASMSPSNYLPDLEMGNETLLNTKEYAFASYFIRMKQQMEVLWNPQGVLGKGNLDREVYLTSVSIVLDSKGKLVSVKVVDPSGDFELDQEAIRTVRDASPYLNPPAALIESDQMIRVPKWSFIVTRKRVF